MTLSGRSGSNFTQLRGIGAYLEPDPMRFRPGAIRLLVKGGAKTARRIVDVDRAI